MTPGWRPGVLPLHHTRLKQSRLAAARALSPKIEGGQRKSEEEMVGLGVSKLQPRDYRSRALPLELQAGKKGLTDHARVGREMLLAASELLSQMRDQGLRGGQPLEEDNGSVTVTYAASNRVIDNVLVDGYGQHGRSFHEWLVVNSLMFGAPAGTRTPDELLVGQPLLPLSYGCI